MNLREAIGPEAPARVLPVAATAVVLALAPLLGSDDGPVLCISRRHTDVACPGCGLTRAISSLTRLDVAGSWRMHPVALFLVLQAVLVAGVGAFSQRPTLDRLWSRWVPMLLLADAVALVVVWIVRYSNGTLPLA